jgi:two-component system sensor histidine kinase/response regulator
MCLLIMLSLGIFAYGGYQLVVQPAINELALSEMSGVAQKVQSRLENTFSGVEGSLQTSRNWAEITRARPTQEYLARFAETFIPVIAQRNELSAIIFADDTGREILLIRTHDGQLVTRVSDPVGRGRSMDWRTWNRRGEVLTDEKRQINYDARTRPWFKGAIAQTAAEGIYWTDPYTFLLNQEPGVTGVIHWTGSDGRRYILAHDVALLGLSRLTASLQVGQRGIVTLLDEQGALLAVPHIGTPIDAAQLSAKALKPAESAGIPVLTAGVGRWRAEGSSSSIITPFSFQNERWLALFEPTEVAGRIAWLATFAPADEFLPTGPRVIALLLAITLAAMAAAIGVALRIARKMARPLELLTKESERIGRLELDAPISSDGELSNWQEVQQLGVALNTMRQRLLDATGSLEQARAELELRVDDRTQALAHQVRLVEALLDTIPNAIFYKGADTRFMGCNQAYETLFGVMRSQFVGKTVLDLEYLPIEVREAYQAEDARVVQECSRVSRNEDILFADGKVHNTLYSVTGFRNPDGTPAGLIGIIVDVTELKTAEQTAIKASQAARAAADAKAMFLANMSHEIRTPMNAILGLTHLVLQMEMPSRQRSHLEKVNGAAQGLLVLINDILDFSKIEAGKMVCENAELSLDAVVAQLVDVLSMRSRDKGLELLFDIAGDVPDRLMGDAVRLGQVLTNLVGNAIKFTERGEITVSVSCLSKNLDQTMLRFAVQDTGVGMNAAELARIFSAFTQADSSTTRRFGGTGLGLSISKHIVELMGGTIEVQSTPGQGSIFSFNAAFGAVTQSALADGGQAILDLSGVRALIVDDNAAARVVFEHILQGHGLHTRTAAHGEDALGELQRSQAAGEPYQLLILDWKMARLDGIQTLRKIQKALGAQAPRCIMATAYDPDALQEELGMTPVSAVLQKPITGKLLMDAIRAALANDAEQQACVSRPGAPANLSGLQQLLGGTHVLLVEDNITNQELALELLGAVGVTADVADNGADALKMLALRAYALVLMDCQMPVMDGYEATRQLRCQPQFADLPVIAMTASAMEGERERCLAAGMSDYISKPIDLGLLYSKLVHWAPREGRSVASGSTGSTAAPSSNVPSDGTNETLNEPEALSRTNGNQALYERLLRKFNEREADTQQRLDAALRAGDRDLALRTVHNLKGIAATIGADKLSAACLTLESELRSPSHAPDSVVQAMQAWQSALAALLAHLRQRTPIADAFATSASNAQTPAQSLEHCRELQTLLTGNDARASRSAEALALALQTTPHAQEARLIAHHATRFDYDAALQDLRALVADLD